MDLAIMTEPGRTDRGLPGWLLFRMSQAAQSEIASSRPISSAAMRALTITKVQLIIGLEIHVELSTHSKMFSRIGSIAHPDNFGAAPNTMIDELTLGLPGSLPVLNLAAVESSIALGLALGCSISPVTRWDRKSYFYPDMPKNYQISQYEQPLCFDGSVTLPHINYFGDAAGKPDFDAAMPGPQIGIIRAHLEEDAGKLLHELPGGLKLDDASIVDFNRAGTPLLEIVTQPDFTTADQVMVFAQMLRDVCRFLGITEGIMQKGHMRFEPNINCILTLADGHIVKTPIVEVKNLNSFKSLRGAILYELAQQPGRWQKEGFILGSGTKSTRGWDDVAEKTFVQREKEEAADYRYFPDPDLLPVRISEKTIDRIRQSLPELPQAKRKRFVSEYGLMSKEAAALIEEPAVCAMFEQSATLATATGLAPQRAAKQAANFILQSGAKRANERSALAAHAASDEARHQVTATPLLASDLGITAAQLAGLIKLREDGAINSNAADELFGLLCEPTHANADPAALAKAQGMIVLRDDAAMDRWCEAAIAEHPQAATDVRAGKQQALGRLVGAAMKQAAGKGDAAMLREALLKKLS